MNIKEIAKEMTREEFTKKFDSEDWCATYYDLDNIFKGSNCYVDGKLQKMQCHKCIEQAIKDVKFKGEDEVKEYFTDEAMKMQRENGNLIFERISDGLRLSTETDSNLSTHFVWNSGHEYLSPNDKWHLVPHLIQVSIDEAMKAFGENKKVVFEIRGEKFNYTGLNVQGGHYLNEYSINPLCKLTQFNVAEGIGPTLEHYFHEALLYGTWYVEE